MRLKSPAGYFYPASCPLDQRNLLYTSSHYSSPIVFAKILSKELIIFLLSSTDVFHWDCLNSYAASLPTNTAPAGYTCPNCKVRD